MSTQKVKIQETPSANFITQLELLLSTKDSVVAKRVGYVDQLYELHAQVIGVYRTYFKARSEEAKSPQLQILRKELESRAIKYKKTTSALNLLFTLLFDKNAKDASFYACVIRIALDNGQDEKTYCAWVKSHHGLADIKKQYASRRASKDRGQTTRRPEQNDEPASLCLARVAADKQKYTATLDTKNMTQDGTFPTLNQEYAAILVKQNDGSLAIKAIVSSIPTVESVYLGFYNEQKLWNKESSYETVSKLLNEDGITFHKIANELGPDIVNELQEDLNSTNWEFNHYRDIPDELKMYQKILGAADRQYPKSQKNGEGLYQKALDVLVDAEKMNPLVASYVDRKITEDCHLDPESLPRLKISTSSHNLLPVRRISRKDAMRGTIRTLLTKFDGRQIPRRGTGFGVTNKSQYLHRLSRME